jgi:hypothetical protein
MSNGDCCGPTASDREGDAAVAAAGGPLVEVLYFDGCPNHHPAVGLVERVSRELGIETDVHRVRGVDVDPETKERADYALSCRLFRTKAGFSGQPDEFLGPRRALAMPRGRLCKCGCGRRTGQPNHVRWVDDHKIVTEQARAASRAEARAASKTVKPCDCGCGRPTASSMTKYTPECRSRIAGERSRKALADRDDDHRKQLEEELAKPCVVRCSRCSWSEETIARDAARVFAVHRETCPLQAAA